jgi:class 3 adenylate cyclase/tetratricopeptide (TPR) repeat protein
MTCSHCGGDNAAGKKFCGDCGGALESRCPQCGAENPGGKKFCGDCGAELQGTKGLGGYGVKGSTPVARTASTANPFSYTPKYLVDKILQAKSNLEGERKQVTVLFADVKSSMEMAEQLDPEEWSRIMQRFFRMLSEGVERFDGFVDKFTGDGIMALFGAPITHEDHAQRACYAALHLQEQMRAQADHLRLESGLSFSVRIGLNSGEVVVGSIGDDLRMEYTAQGYVVGMASRMEQICEPGRVYLTEHTARLVDGYFELRDLGATQVKGVSRSVRVHELLGVGALRTRFDLSRLRGLSKFVGRQTEMQILEEALGEARAGRGRVVGVVGHAGVGKSRLCFEFTAACRARGVRVYEAHGVSHQKSAPLLPVLELFRSYFGINKDDDDRTAREKIAGRMLLLDSGFTDVLPLMFDFLGVADPARPAPEMSGDARQHALFGVIRRLANVQVQQPESVVFLLEDLHWLDPASAAFVAQLVDSVPKTHTLVLGNYRPEFQARWTKGDHFRLISLEPLGPAAAEELLGTLLGTDASLAGLAHRVVERTGGNPFYMEEVVQSLIEDGALQGGKGAYRLVRPVGEVVIPSTVQTILTARIDRLPPAAKHLLQVAAVIGKMFPRPLLERVLAETDQALEGEDLDGTLAVLFDGEFLFEQAIYPVQEYSFKHALTLEVSYNALLADRRRLLHVATARAFENAAGRKAEESAALIGRQWEGAEDWLAAARWYAQAAEWMMRGDVIGAMQHFRTVRDLLRRVAGSTEGDRIDLRACLRLLDLGVRVGFEADEQERTFERGMALADQLGDREAAGLLESLRGRAGYLAGRGGGPTAPEASVATDPESVLSLATTGIGAGIFFGTLPQAVEASEEATALIERRPELLTTMPASAGVLGLRALALAYSGRLDEAEQLSARALETARATGQIEREGFANQYRSFTLLARGHAQEALRLTRRALEIAETLGSPLSRVVTRANCGEVGAFLGLWPDTESWGQEGVEILRQHQVVIMFEPLLLAYWAEALAARGEGARAEELIAEAITKAQSFNGRLVESRAHLARARILRRASASADAGAIAAALLTAEKLAREIGLAAWLGWIAEEHAALALAGGDEAKHRAHLDRARRLYEDIGATGHIERLTASVHS